MSTLRENMNKMAQTLTKRRDAAESEAIAIKRNEELHLDASLRELGDDELAELIRVTTNVL